jgi:hypothetical protein
MIAAAANSEGIVGNRVRPYISLISVLKGIKPEKMKGGGCMVASGLFTTYEKESELGPWE